MKTRFLLGLAAASLILPPLVAAEPPAHAPAHGYRAKHDAPRAAIPKQEGIDVVFDSERGIHVAIGLPDVFFYSGHYYRERDGRWEVSLSGKDGWRISASAEIPGRVVEARKKGKKSHPGPAKRGEKRAKRD